MRIAIGLKAWWRVEVGNDWSNIRAVTVTALNADLIVSIHRVIQKGSDFISIESTSDLTGYFTAQWMWPKRVVINSIYIS